MKSDMKCYVKTVDECADRTDDVATYENGYADGFDRGEEAIVQQVDGIVCDKWMTDSEKVIKVIEMLHAFWKERES